MSKIKNISEVYLYDEDGNPTHEFITITSDKDQQYMLKIKLSGEDEARVLGTDLIRAAENGMNVGISNGKN